MMAVELTTRESIARSILENGPSTALALSERLGITPAGIRRHLDALEEEGIIEAREPRASINAGRGRPSKVFVMTDLGRTSFEHSYDDLAISALRFISTAGTFGSTGVKAFARSRAEEMERKFETLTSRRVSKKSDTTKALADFLSDEGYAASINDLPIGSELCQHHCPIAHVAAEFPQLCEMETEIFSRILNTHVQRLATIAHGDGVCTTFIPSIPNNSSNPSNPSNPSNSPSSRTKPEKSNPRGKSGKASR